MLFLVEPFTRYSTKFANVAYLFNEMVENGPSSFNHMGPPLDVGEIDDIFTMFTSKAQISTGLLYRKVVYILLTLMSRYPEYQWSFYSRAVGTDAVQSIFKCSTYIESEEEHIAIWHLTPVWTFDKILKTTIANVNPNWGERQIRHTTFDVWWYEHKVRFVYDVSLETHTCSIRMTRLKPSISDRIRYWKLAATDKIPKWGIIKIEEVESVDADLSTTAFTNVRTHQITQ